ncbi:MAG: hypothetical protein O2856_11025 [Planctomycetota bacterium]|nr:hypothetical protein [Planctomycetota bacterium]
MVWVFGYLDRRPTVIGITEIRHKPIGLADCGIGLKIRDADPVLRLRGWARGENRERFPVGEVSISWGLLARVPMQDIMFVLLEHSFLKMGWEGPGKIHGQLEDVRYSSYPHILGSIHVVTRVGLNETDMRFFREIELRPTEYFLD